MHYMNPGACIFCKQNILATTISSEMVGIPLTPRRWKLSLIHVSLLAQRGVLTMTKHRDIEGFRVVQSIPHEIGLSHRFPVIGTPGSSLYHLAIRSQFLPPGPL